MASNEIARTAPGTPQPGPAVDPSLPTWQFVPTASPLQTLAPSDLAAVSGNPGYAGPVALNPTSQMVDFGPAGQSRIDGQPAPSDTSQGP